MTSRIVTACPECGNIVANSCWHDDREEITSVEMTTARCRELLLSSLGETLRKADGIRTDLNNLAKIDAEANAGVLGQIERRELTPEQELEALNELFYNERKRQGIEDKDAGPTQEMGNDRAGSC